MPYIVSWERLRLLPSKSRERFKVRSPCYAVQPNSVRAGLERPPCGFRYPGVV
jgi:hypothetical protein